ncbi:MAG: DUF1697 domain-containing protein [Solirubrobacterales bacterium]
MQRNVAFLRGMNLGGRRIKDEELRREFEQLGFGEVAIFPCQRQGHLRRRQG